jgi:hypothetical protein
LLGFHLFLSVVESGPPGGCYNPTVIGGWLPSLTFIGHKKNEMAHGHIG